MNPSSNHSDDTLGPYRLVRPLGRGGMGEVWLAFDQRLQRLVAVKRIRPEVAQDPVRRERFRREARLVARLHHPNVVQVFELLERDDGDALVLEYVDGSSLYDLLRDSPLAPHRAVEVATAVARGLEAAHDAGLVHRDLKSGNVLVSRDGEVKILDFGLAKPLGPDPEATLTGERDLLGTAHAMAPEQILGESVDARTDLFALGVLIYEMLTGEPPFRAATLAEVLRDILVRGPQRPLAEAIPELPTALHALVDELLAKEPDDRPATAALVVRRLEGIARQVPGSPREEPTLSQLDERPTLVPSVRPVPEEAAADAGSRSAGEPKIGRRPRRLTLGSSGRRGVVGAAALGLILAVGAIVAARWPAGTEIAEQDPAPLRVAIARPAAESGTGDTLLVTSVMVGLQRGLLAIEGLTPVDPSSTELLSGGPLEVARAVAADEVLRVRVGIEDGLGLVSLSRLRAGDGSVLWAEGVQVPAAPDDGLITANALMSALRRAYSGYGLRAEAPDLEARSTDYAEYLRVEQRIEIGEPDLEPDLRRLERIAVSSPRFIDAHVLAAHVALSLYSDARDPVLLEHAAAAVERGRALVPQYPPLVRAQIRLALTEGDHERAEQWLSDLEAALPGDPQLSYYRARLADGRGRLEEAIAVLRLAVERRATWRELVYLADYEYRAGEIEAARHRLEAALELAPGNEWPLSKLARLELNYGDLDRAARLYEDLAATEPHRSDLVNLGLVRYLLGDFEAAVESYRRAEELYGFHFAIAVNLADAELARGRDEEARRLYARALIALEELERTAPLRSAELTIKAQCLLHLERVQEAVEQVIEALREHPEDAEVLYQSALVFALAGEEASALACAREALELGYPPRWLTIPGFEALRSREDFARLLSGAAAD